MYLVVSLLNNMVSVSSMLECINVGCDQPRRANSGYVLELGVMLVGMVYIEKHKAYRPYLFVELL